MADEEKLSGNNTEFGFILGTAALNLCHGSQRGGKVRVPESAEMARRLFLLLPPLLGAHALGPSPSGLYDCALSQDLGCFRGAGDNGVSACLSPATTGRHLRVSV
jgi:hypothetical protein